MDFPSGVVNNWRNCSTLISVLSLLLSSDLCPPNTCMWFVTILLYLKAASKLNFLRFEVLIILFSRGRYFFIWNSDKIFFALLQKIFVFGWTRFFFFAKLCHRFVCSCFFFFCVLTKTCFFFLFADEKSLCLMECNQCLALFEQNAKKTLAALSISALFFK